MPDSGLRHLHKRKRIHQKYEKYPHPHKFKRIMDHMIYIVCVATPLVVLPQVWKIWSEQNAGGISLVTYSGLVVANVIWVIYGTLHKEKPIVMLYISFFVINSLILVGRILYG